MRAKFINEFERGTDPKTSMRIGKNRNNPFLDNPDTRLFLKYLKSQGEVSEDDLKIAESTAELLGVKSGRIKLMINDWGKGDVEHISQEDAYGDYIDDNIIKKVIVTEEIELHLSSDNLVYVIYKYEPKLSFPPDGFIQYELGTIY